MGGQAADPQTEHSGRSLLTSPLRINLGLRTKFFLYSNTLIVATMSLVTVLSVVHERAARTEAIERRGRSIVEALAIPIAGALPDATAGTAEGGSDLPGHGAGGRPQP